MANTKASSNRSVLVLVYFLLDSHPRRISFSTETKLLTNILHFRARAKQIKWRALQQTRI